MVVQLRSRHRPERDLSVFNRFGFKYGFGPSGDHHVGFQLSFLLSSFVAVILFVSTPSFSFLFSCFRLVPCHHLLHSIHLISFGSLLVYPVAAWLLYYDCHTKVSVKHLILLVWSELDTRGKQSLYL